MTLDAFQGLKIAIVGDVMLDKYTVGTVSRMSPEAPVPVVLLEQEENRIGGAGNVALNVVALGAEAFVCSVIGNDQAGLELQELFSMSQIDTSGLILDETRKTTTKTRVIANHKHLLRIDNETLEAIHSSLENQLILKTKEIIDLGMNALIFEDYNKGVLTERVINEITTYALSRNIVVSVDPKKDHFLSYKHVSLFKPNLKEVKEGLNIAINPALGIKDLVTASNLLREKLNHKLTFITLSEFGVFMDDGHESFLIPAHRRDIADVSGAGDTVIAVATLCLSLGMSTQMIAEISNIAGGLVCEQPGVVSVNRDDLEREMSEHLNHQT